MLGQANSHLLRVGGSRKTAQNLRKTAQNSRKTHPFAAQKRKAKLTPPPRKVRKAQLLLRSSYCIIRPGAGCIMYNTYYLYNTFNTVLCIMYYVCGCFVFYISPRSDVSTNGHVVDTKRSRSVLNHLGSRRPASKSGRLGGGRLQRTLMDSAAALAQTQLGDDDAAETSKLTLRCSNVVAACWGHSASRRQRACIGV